MTNFDALASRFILMPRDATVAVGDEVRRQRKDLANVFREVAATGWDGAVRAMRYEDGTPVEIVAVVNPYRKETT